MRKLTRNAIKCKRCGDVVESKARHDFKVCSCGCVFVDGGLGYTYNRIGWPAEGKPEDWYEDLCEYEEVDPK